MKRRLIGLFLLLVLLKIIASLLIVVPLGFSDSLTYQASGKIFYDTQSLVKISESKYPPIYPILISPAFMFKDMNIALMLIKAINSILSSLIIFPVYLLSKEFLSRKKSFLIASISAFMPPYFIFTFTPMSENIFYPLVASAIYLS